MTHRELTGALNARLAIMLKMKYVHASSRVENPFPADGFLTTCKDISNQLFNNHVSTIFYPTLQLSHL